MGRNNSLRKLEVGNESKPLTFAGIFPMTETLVFRYSFLSPRDNSRYEWMSSREK